MKKSPAPKPVESTASPQSAPSDGTSLPKRLFECTEDGASKFWQVWLEGCDLTTRWGKIGTNGQEKTKPFATPDKARKEYDKLLAEKTGKGYEEVQG